MSDRTQFILSLSGYARTGKDTIAQILAEEHGAVRVAFADAVREMAAELYGLPPDAGWWEAYKPQKVYAGRWGAVCDMLMDAGYGDPTYRDLLIHVGMTVRKRGPNIWLNIGLRKISAAYASGHSVVITDARFPNEVQHLYGFHNAICWKVQRPGCEAQGSADRQVDLINPSYLSATINNHGGTVEDLRALVLKTLEQSWAQ